MKYSFGIMLFALFIFSHVKAATITWNGSVDNDWSNNANWIGGVKPGVGDYAIINGAGFTVDISTTENIQGVRIIHGTLNITASGLLNCDGALNPGLWIQGDVNNNGTINLSNISHAGIQMNNNKTFNNNGTLTINGTSQPGINLISDAIFNNNGILTINGTATAGLSLGAATCSFTNNGNANLTIGDSGSIGAQGIVSLGTIVTTSNSTIEIDNTSFAGLQNSTGSSFTNGGNLIIGENTICANHGIRNYSNFSNTGALTIGEVAAQFSCLENESGSSFDNSGTLAISDFGSLAINNITTATFSNTGTLMGAGTINIDIAANFMNQGVVSPGFSPGELTYQGAFQSTTLEIELESPTSFDKLLFSGGSSSDYLIAGNLNIDLLNGYSPAIGETFEIITSPVSYNGAFNNINYPTASSEWTIYYNEFDITIEFIGPSLAVELIDFTAEPNKNEVILAWSTASEINNIGFQVQRSIDAKTWEDIYWVDSKIQTSSQIQQYQCIDRAPKNGRNYYRLIQYDLDSSRNILHTISAKLSNLEKNEIVVYPNPVTEILHFKYHAQNNIESIKIYNIDGKLMMDSDKIKSSIDVSGFTEGTYFMELKTVSSIQTFTFIKK